MSARLVKIGRWGGNSGSVRDIRVPPKGLVSVTIRSGGSIDAIAFTYVGTDGKHHLAGPWGGTRGSPTTIALGTGEFVREISGTFNNSIVRSSLRIVTNVTHYNFGTNSGTAFSVPLVNGRVVGFFARSGTFLNAIGVYVQAQP